MKKTPCVGVKGPSQWCGGGLTSFICFDDDILEAFSCCARVE